MDVSHLQPVVDAENKRRNDVALAKAAAELREIEAINASIARLTANRTAAQQRIADLKFDEFTLDELIAQSPTAPVVEG
jgi:hypothetical protein